MRRRAAGMAALLFLLAGCERDGGPPVPAPYLRLAERDDVPTLDPAVGYDTTSWMFEEALFNTLVDYDDGVNIVGELATAWQVSEDGREYVFDLRDDARFTSGRKVEAGDIKFSLERVLDPATRSPGAEFFRVIEGAAECKSGSCSVAGIEVRAPTRLAIRLAQLDPLFLHKLAMPFASAVPREEVQRWGEDFSRHAAGSGPFRLERWDSGQRLTLVRNPQYHVSGVPRLAGVEYSIGVSEELAWFKYEAGEIDLSDVPSPQFPAVVRSERYAPLLRHVTEMTTRYLGMNCEMPPFDDVRVRRAMNHAIDKEKILRLVNQRGVVARGFLPPAMPGHQVDLGGYPHDPARARELLAEAGRGDGFATTLWLRMSDDGLRIAQAIQQDLREVGVTLELRPMAWAPFLELVKTPRQVPLFFLAWQADFPDPSNFLETLLHSKNRGSNNDTFFSNPAFDALLDRAARTIDSEQRMRLLQQAERDAVAAAPWVFLYHPESYVLLHPRVRDFRLHALRPWRFDRVWLADAGR